MKEFLANCPFNQSQESPTVCCAKQAKNGTCATGGWLHPVTGYSWLLKSTAWQVKLQTWTMTVSLESSCLTALFSSMNG